jgi:hypothetical protein
MKWVKNILLGILIMLAGIINLIVILLIVSDLYDNVEYLIYRRKMDKLSQKMVNFKVVYEQPLKDFSLKTKELDFWWDNYNIGVVVENIDGEKGKELIITSDIIYSFKDSIFVPYNFDKYMPKIVREKLRIRGIGDIDGDKKKEIFFLKPESELVVIEHKNQKWVKKRGEFPNCVIGDIDGDGIDELVSWHNIKETPFSYKIVVYKWDRMKFIEIAKSDILKTVFFQPIINDIDGDSLDEIIIFCTGLENAQLRGYVLKLINGENKQIRIFRYVDWYRIKDYLYVGGFGHYFGAINIEGKVEKDIIFLGMPPGIFDRYSLFLLRWNGENYEVLKTNIDVDTFLIWAGNLYGDGRNVILTISRDGVLRVYEKE